MGQQRGSPGMHKNYEIKVVFPHDSGLGPDRCDTSCTEGSLGSLKQNNLCEPKEGTCGAMVDINDLASKRCEAYAQLLPFLHPDGNGKQVHHQPSKGSWLSCAVFCQTRKGAWYSPRQELAGYFLERIPCACLAILPWPPGAYLRKENSHPETSSSLTTRVMS